MANGSKKRLPVRTVVIRTAAWVLAGLLVLSVFAAALQSVLT